MLVECWPMIAHGFDLPTIIVVWPLYNTVIQLIDWLICIQCRRQRASQPVPVSDLQDLVSKESYISVGSTSALRSAGKLRPTVLEQRQELRD